MHAMLDAYRSGQLITLADHQSLMGELVKSMDASLESGIKSVSEAIMAQHTAAVQAAVEKAVEAEREACADLAVNRHWHWGELGNACLVDDDVSACADIAAAIRSRGVAG